MSGFQPYLPWTTGFPTQPTTNDAASSPDASGNGRGTHAASPSSEEPLDSGKVDEHPLTKRTWKGTPSFQNAGPIVKINVGSGKAKKEYLVHKNFATYWSSVFEKAFNGPFLEGQTQVMDLDDFEFPEVFGYVQSWMYSQNLKAANKEWAPSGDDLCRLWVLADRLLMRKLQGDVVHSLCCSSSIPTLETDNINCARWIYENTSPESPLRRLFADKCAFHSVGLEGVSAANLEKLPKEFLLDVALAYKRVLPPCNCHSKNQVCGCTRERRLIPGHYDLGRDSRQSWADYRDDSEYQGLGRLEYQCIRKSMMRARQA